MRYPAARRAGLTLVEVMVALVIVAVGLLGIAGSSALMSRAITAHLAEHGAIRRAGIRIATTGAAGCAAGVVGSSTDPSSATHETWQASPIAAGVIAIEDSIEWQSPGGLRSLVVRSAHLC